MTHLVFFEAYLIPLRLIKISNARNCVCYKIICYVHASEISISLKQTDENCTSLSNLCNRDVKFEAFDKFFFCNILICCTFVEHIRIVFLCSS